MSFINTSMGFVFGISLIPIISSIIGDSSDKLSGIEFAIFSLVPLMLGIFYIYTFMKDI